MSSSIMDLYRYPNCEPYVCHFNQPNNVVSSNICRWFTELVCNKYFKYITKEDLCVFAAPYRLVEMISTVVQS